MAVELVDFVVVPTRERERAAKFYGASFFDPDGNGLAIHRRYAPYLDGSEP